MAIDPNSSAFTLAPTFTDTPPQAAVQSPAPEEKQGFIRRNSLKLAGWLNLLGDASLLVAGIQARDRNMAAGGGLYTAGALAAARYGNAGTERQLQEVSLGTAELIKQQTGHLPEDSGLATLMAKKRNEGLFQKTENFLYRHPADTMLGAYTAGAGAMLASGIKNNNKKRVRYGLWSLGVKAISFLLPEEQEKPVSKKEQESMNPIQKLINWFREKPLRFFGIASVVTEVLLTQSVIEDYKDPKKKKSAIFGFVTAGAYICSDILMAISSKDPANANGKFNADDQRRVEDLAADAIAREPQEKQTALIREVSEFLAARPEINAKADGIAQSIQQRVERKTQGAWVSRTQDTQALQPAR